MGVWEARGGFGGRKEALVIKALHQGGDHGSALGSMGTALPFPLEHHEDKMLGWLGAARIL